MTRIKRAQGKQEDLVGTRSRRYQKLRRIITIIYNCTSLDVEKGGKEW